MKVSQVSPLAQSGKSWQIVTIACEGMEENKRCDTSFVEYWNAGSLLVKKVIFQPEKITIMNQYDTLQRLSMKSQFDNSGNLLKVHEFHYGIAGTEYVDSVFNSERKLLVALVRKADSLISGRFHVEWYFSGDHKPATNQIIQLDSAGNEISNSTCYENGECITYRHYYSGSNKVLTELWTINSRSSMPSLVETEEFYYRNPHADWGSIRFSEPRHVQISETRSFKITAD